MKVAKKINLISYLQKKKSVTLYVTDGNSTDCDNINKYRVIMLPIWN